MFGYFSVETNNPFQETQEVFFVSPNTIISGAENIFISKNQEMIYATSEAFISGTIGMRNVNLIVLSDVTVVAKNVNDSANILGISKTFSVEKTIKNQNLKELGDKVVEKVLATFFSSLQEHQSLRFEILKEAIGNGSISISCYSFYTNNALEESHLNNVAFHNSRKEFYTLLSNFRSCKLTPLFLRGPPLA